MIAITYAPSFVDLAFTTNTYTTAFAENREIMLNCFQLPRRKYRVEPSERCRSPQRNRKWAHGNYNHSLE